MKKGNPFAWKFPAAHPRELAEKGLVPRSEIYSEYMEIDRRPKARVKSESAYLTALLVENKE